MPAGTSPNRNSKSPLMNDSMLREPNNRTPILILWAVLICCVVNRLPGARRVSPHGRDQPPRHLGQTATFWLFT